MRVCKFEVGFAVALVAQERGEEEGRVGQVVEERKRASRIMRKGPVHANPIRQSARCLKFNTSMGSIGSFQKNNEQKDNKTYLEVKIHFMTLLSNE